MNRFLPSRRWRALTLATAAVTVASLIIPAPAAHAAGPSIVSKTFAYTGKVETFTVPDGITSLTITVTGGEGGNGGADATPAPPPGGYRGVVTGTISVTPGQVLTVGVGGGGGTGASQTNGNTAGPTGGSNPLTGYAGGIGGRSGSNGSSGVGGAGGAASVLRIAGVDVVAGGGGGNGGSGQFSSTRGRDATSTYTGRADIVSTNGQAGINANDACVATSCSNNDGGGSGGGGGGAQGGAQGNIEFGAGSSNEWFGYGGSVGQNSTAQLSGLIASYAYYADNGTAGSVVISYSTGSPAAPTAVNGTAGNGAVALVWSAPTDTGQSAITGYVARYSSNGGSSWSSTVDLGTTDTSGTVTGLTNGTTYVFQIAAVNSVGTGLWSGSSSPVTPLGPPTAPTISAVTAQDGALGLSLTAPSSGAPVTAYDYRVDGGAWVPVASTSTSLVIPGLVNGTSYSVEVRAESSVGVGAVSAPVSGTPLAVPGAPTISSVGVSVGTFTVDFTPGFSGGGAISSYEYQLNGGSWVAASGTSSPITITGLAAGTTYAVSVRAVNSVGAGAASAPSSATTPALPGAPTISAVVAGDGSARVSFTPGSSGGSSIQGYEYQTSAAGTWTTVPGASSPLLISGLSNGTTYSVRVRATNAVGTGPASSAVAVTPATVPGAPTIVGDTVAGNDATLSAAFTAPSTTGGSAITGYEYSTDGGATWRARTDGAGVASPVVITTLSSDGTTPLTDGVTYLVELRAVNAVGAGTASAVATGMSTSAPSAPTITSVTPSSGALSVSFTAGSNGGSAVTAYQYSVDHGAHWTSTGTLGTSFAITGLSNGTAYPVQVRAVNAVGAGAASAAVTKTPAGWPGQASITSVVRSDQTLTASVTLADNGGSPVTGWEYSTDGGATWFTAPGTTSPLTLTVVSSDGRTRLANGTGYALQVRAVTAVGTGPASPTTIVAPASAPTAPSIAVTPGNTSASIAFTLGTDGGSPVTQLEYSLDGGTTWTPAGTLSSPLTISGLTNGTTYPVRLRADNAIGTGTPSVPAATTPRTVPGAVDSVTATSNTSSADVTWAAPADNGGAPVTGYTVKAYASSTGTTTVSTCTTTGATSCTVPGLTNGTVYYLEVVATNAAGSGAPSTPRVLVTPLARPGAPNLTGLTAGDGSLSASFTAGSAGDRAITGYQYTIDGGTTWVAGGTSSPIMITGLVNGTAYTVAIRAVSAAGVGATSNTRTATPYTYPSAPDASRIIANGGDGQITVSWAAANLNGGTLLNYTATAFTDLTSGSTKATCTTTTLSCVITGLTNGTTYYVSLQTENTALMYSVRSAPRIPATPSRQPGAPTAVTATAGNGQATVSWAAPMSTGASAISGYTIRCSADGGPYTSCGTSTGTSTVITGLVNGSSYTFQVYAANSNGAGPTSTASDAVTPLAPGTTPVLTPASSTATGFTSTISNFDPAATYSVAVTGGASAVLLGSTVTVSGLEPGAGADLTVTDTKRGYETTHATVSGAALYAGVAPVLGAPTRTTDGFGVAVTNFDPTSTYSVSATAGSVELSGTTVVVTGLAPGASSTVTVTVSRAGYADASASRSGAALGAATVPTFSDTTPLEGGYRFTITNYDPSLEYTLSQADGATVTRDADVVTVSGLANGVSSQTTVVVSQPGHVDGSASVSGSSLPDGVAPVVSPVTRTADGYSFTITLVPGTTYSVSSDAPTVVLLGSTVTVSGLTPGASASVVVTASRSDALDASTTVHGTALDAGVTPTLSEPVATAGGFGVTITNFDADTTYSATATNGASVVISGADVTVTGLADGASADVTVTAAKDGCVTTEASATGSALPAGTAPMFGTLTRTADGFTLALTNLDPNSTYTLTTTHGSVSLSGSTVTVTGLTPDEWSSVTVTVSHPGYADASASQSGVALGAATVPTFSDTTPLEGGYRFTITNYDPSLTYQFVQADGGTVTADADVVTVSGLANGTTSDTTVVVSNPGHVDGSASVSGSSLPDGVAPVVSPVTRTADGYSFTITLVPGTTYSVSSDAPTVVLLGSTVTVSGLTPGASASVVVTASRSDALDASTTVQASALEAGIAPTFGTPVRTADGFTVDVTNFDATSSYAVSATDGAVTLSGTTLTVTGLAPDAASTVTVTVSHAGSTDATATATGTALGAGTVPTFSDATPLAGGYEFTITNYDPSLTYTFVQADGGTVTRDAGTVTVSGLGNGVTSDTAVTVSQPGHVDASATETGSTLVDGTAPVVSPVTRTTDGFRLELTLVPGTTYTVTSDAGTVVLVGSTVTVLGLAPGASATVTVTASTPGALDATTTVLGTALEAGVAPTFSAPVATSDGFTVTITNYSPDVTYDMSASAGSVSRNGATLTVTGLARGTKATVHVVTSRTGYESADASVTGRSLDPAPVAPTTPAATPATSSTPSASPSTTTGGAKQTSSPAVLAGLPQSAPGTGQVTAGGTAVASTISTVGGVVTVTTPEGLRLSVVARQDDVALPLGPDGVVEVGPNGRLSIAVTGFGPESDLTFWTLGDQGQLGTGRTDTTGQAASTVQLPAGLAAGVQTLVVTGVDAQGRTVTMQVAIRVLAGNTAAVTSAALGGWWIWSLAGLAAVLVAGGWWFFLIARRRREEEEEGQEG